MSKCPRVEARIECPECGYPIGEAMHALASVWQPISGYNVHDVQPHDDPGHMEDDDE